MALKKYFTKWVKEAGRGHLTAFLSWGSLAAYAMIAVVRLDMSTETSFFGIGSNEFLWLCEGLGFALSFLEFSYLLQPKKLDFYYGLPVKRGTIFWSRYVHGVVHFMIPLILTMTACGLFESSVDLDFMPYSAGYTGRSILTFAAIFLIFYHIGILFISICGNVLSAVLGYAIVLVYENILIGNAFTIFAKNYFRTYYRIPLLEKLDVQLAPLSLSGSLAGAGIYDKKAVLEYIPPVSDIAAAFVWLIFLLILFSIVQKKRKTERVGKIFAIPLAERAAEFWLSFAAGVWSGSLFIDLSGLAAGKPGVAFVISILLGVLAASAVHFLLEWGVGGLSGWKGNSNPIGQDAVKSHAVVHRTIGHSIFHITWKRKPERSGIFRRKWQFIAECAAVIFAGAAFFTGASSFDGFVPEMGEVEKIGISVDGIDMDGDVYRLILEGESRYETDRQLEKYLLAGEGKDAVEAWVVLLAERGYSNNRNSGTGYTHAVVCYHMKNGKEIYRIYPVSEEELQAYASVYETEEYKKIAYQTPDSRYVMDARFLWADGVTDTVLKLEDDEKYALLDAWKSDIDSMKMEQLKEALPLGFIEIDSDMRLFSTDIPVYPFFSRTCDFLEKHGMQIYKTLLDYPVLSVSVVSVPSNGFGNQGPKYYQESEDIERWRAKAVPERLDLQPILYPLDYSQEMKMEVEDETTNSAVYVYCYSKTE